METREKEKRKKYEHVVGISITNKFFVPFALTGAREPSQFFLRYQSQDSIVFRFIISVERPYFRRRISAISAGWRFVLFSWMMISLNFFFFGRGLITIVSSSSSNWMSFFGSFRGLPCPLFCLLAISNKTTQNNPKLARKRKIGNGKKQKIKKFFKENVT